MNHLVVYAHPNPQSFCKGILDTVIQASVDKGAGVRVRDLYQIGFEAILKAKKHFCSALSVYPVLSTKRVG